MGLTCNRSKARTPGNPWFWFYISRIDSDLFRPLRMPDGVFGPHPHPQQQAISWCKSKSYPHIPYNATWIPGTWNIHFKMVVSMGWFQIFTWKMIVSPNIHEKNGCFRFQVHIQFYLCSWFLFHSCIAPFPRSLGYRENQIRPRKRCFGIRKVNVL